MYLCDKRPIQHAVADFHHEGCNEVCREAGMCINVCLPCRRDWVKWWSLGTVECPVPCTHESYQTHYEYYCNEDGCEGAVVPAPCCIFDEYPVIRPGPWQTFDICIP